MSGTAPASRIARVQSAMSLRLPAPSFGLVGEVAQIGEAKSGCSPSKRPTEIEIPGSMKARIAGDRLAKDVGRYAA